MSTSVPTVQLVGLHGRHRGVTECLHREEQRSGCITVGLGKREKRWPGVTRTPKGRGIRRRHHRRRWARVAGTGRRSGHRLQYDCRDSRNTDRFGAGGWSDCCNEAGRIGWPNHAVTGEPGSDTGEWVSSLTGMLTGMRLAAAAGTEATFCRTTGREGQGAGSPKRGAVKATGALHARLQLPKQRWASGQGMAARRVRSAVSCAPWH